jgi:hypothetical protein
MMMHDDDHDELMIDDLPYLLHACMPPPCVRAAGDGC